MLHCTFHMPNGSGDETFGFFVLRFLEHRLGLGDSLLLALQKHWCVFAQGGGLTAYLPRGVDNLFLQLNKLLCLLVGGLLLLLLLLLLGLVALTLAENFFEWPNLGKEHVAKGPARLAVRPNVLRPKKPID